MKYEQKLNNKNDFTTLCILHMHHTIKAMQMKTHYWVIMVLLNLGCFPDQNQNIYLIQHSKADTCFVETFGNKYELITWFQDTIFRECGIELNINNPDSTLLQDLEYEVNGATILRYRGLPNKFILQPDSSMVELVIANNDETLFTKTFRSPKLARPVARIVNNEEITTEISQESKYVSITFVQPNNRLGRILPKDLRYRFNMVNIINKNSTQNFRLFPEEGKLDFSEVLSHCSVGDELEVRLDSVFRINYRNQQFLLDNYDQDLSLFVVK